MATIGFDGSRLRVAERTGTETYSAEILQALAEIAVDDELVVYLNDRSSPPDLALPARTDVRPIPMPRFWTHVRLSTEMARRPPDVLFVPAHVVPIWHPASVVTIHDLGYLVEPNSHPAADRLRLDWTTRWSVRAARRVIAVSEATKRAIIGAYRVPPDKIRVVHHGVSARFRRVGADAIQRVRSRYGLPRRYILTVGTIQPRKNLPRLVAAMGQLAADGLPHRLVVVGKRGWLAASVEEDIERTGQGSLVQCLGYVPADDLPAIYCGAEAFALPSLYEGFGMPVLEALACGVPALVSDRAALPEIVGGAALVVDPIDVTAIGNGLVSLLTDEILRASLSVAGRRRAAEFTWQRTATQTLAVLHEAIGDSRGGRWRHRRGSSAWS